MLKVRKPAGVPGLRVTLRGGMCRVGRVGFGTVGCGEVRFCFRRGDMEHPSDKSVLVINQAVRNLRYLFGDVYGFTWVEVDDEQCFDITASFMKQFPPVAPEAEAMAMMSMERFTFDYAAVETAEPGDISGEVFARLSKVESEGFGE